MAVKGNLCDWSPDQHSFKFIKINGKKAIEGSMLH